MRGIALFTATIVLTASPLLASVDDEAQVIERSTRLSDIEATLRVEPASVEVGMPVQLVLTISGEAAPRAVFPVFDETVGNFDVRSTAPLRSDSLGPNVRAMRVDLVGFEAGEHEIPALEISTDGRTLAFDPIKLEVISLLAPAAGPEEFHDIRNAISVPLANSALAWWVAFGVLATGGAAFLVWWLLVRNKPLRPAEPADVWADRKLDELNSKQLPEKGQIQAFFFELTDIARSFIERRYDIDAPDRTTQEFISEAQRHHDLDPEHATILGRMLRSADMVKFAGDRPAQTECERSMEYVRRFVRESGPKPESTEVDGEKTDENSGLHSRPERMRAMGLDEPNQEEVLTGRISR